MSITLTLRGVAYTLPSPNDSNEWGAAFNAFLTALAAANPAVTLTLPGSAAAAPLALTPMASPPTGPNVVGMFYVTTAGVLKVCTVLGSPGTWVSVGGQT